MKIGDFVEWGDQGNYPGLCGIITKIRLQDRRLRTLNTPEIFVHWLSFPKDYTVGAGWEKPHCVRVLSAGETQ